LTLNIAKNAHESECEQLKAVATELASKYGFSWEKVRIDGKTGALMSIQPPIRDIKSVLAPHIPPKADSEPAQ